MFRYQVSTIRTASFRLITKCPRATDTRLAKQCTSNIETILSRIPIFDVNTGFNYNNLYCAVCHNVDTENIKIWPPIFDTGCACTLGERGCEAKREVSQIVQLRPKLWTLVCQSFRIWASYALPQQCPLLWKQAGHFSLKLRCTETCIVQFAMTNSWTARSAIQNIFDTEKLTTKVLSSSLNISFEALIEAKETASRFSKHVMNRSTNGKLSELHVIHVAFLLCLVFYMQQFCFHILRLVTDT